MTTLPTTYHREVKPCTMTTPRCPRIEFGEDPIEAGALGGVQRCNPVDVLRLLQLPNLTQLLEVVLRNILGTAEPL